MLKRIQVCGEQLTIHLYLKKSHFNFFPHSVCWLKIPMMNLVGFYKTKSVERGLKVINLLFQPFDSQDLISNSPYCLPNNSFDVSSEKLGIGSAINPLIDIFLHSHHLSAWYCTDIVRRNSFLVTYGVKVSSEPRVMWIFNPLTIFAQGTESLIGTFSARFPYSPIQL